MNDVKLVSYGWLTGSDDCQRREGGMMMVRGKGGELAV